MNNKKVFHIRSRITLVVVVVIAAFLAAFLGQILINSFTNAPSLLPEENFVIKQSTDLISELQSKTSKVLQSETSGFVEIYNNSTVSQVIGRGAVLTNDGWIVVVLSDESSEISTNNIVRLNSGELIGVLKVIKDPASPLVFIQTNSKNLTPITLGNSFITNSLQPYLVASYPNLIQVGYMITERIIGDNYLSSDKKNRYALLTAGNPGDLIYDKNVEMVGIVIGQSADSKSMVIDVSFVKSTLEMMLRKNQIIRSKLGLVYVDLSHNAVPASVSNGLTSGALITTVLEGTPQLVIDRTGPAYTAGIILKDVIVSVDGNPINHNQSLSDYIVASQPGDKVELGILRNGQPITISLELKDIVSKEMNI